MQYIILDLEATCSKDKEMENEIIEIGAVKLNSELEEVSRFSEFISPIKTDKLTDFCKELTTIKQSDVDQANRFAIVLMEFLAWVADDGDTIYGSWGFYDKKQFEKDCKLHGLSTSWLKGNHISIKHQHYDNVLNRVGYKALDMDKALKVSEIPLEGTHHRGIDDAVNTSKIFIKYFDKWDFDLKA